MTRVLVRLIAMAILVSVSTTVQAHHGWGGYDGNTVLNLTGVIHESTYEHPHGTLKLVVENKTWDVVLAPPSRMQVRGLTQEMLTPGTRAAVVGYPHRMIAGEMRAERITISGKTTELR